VKGACGVCGGEEVKAEVEAGGWSRCYTAPMSRLQG
jgi:hypothetical protein